MNTVSKMVESVVVYVVLITIITNLIGNSSYRKYIQVFIGMLLILIVLSPILKLLNWDEKLEFHINMNELTVTNEEMKEQLSMVEGEQKKWILTEYKKSIEVTLEQLVETEGCKFKSCNITFDETNENFGEIESIFMICKEEDNISTEEIKRSIESNSLIKKIEEIKIPSIKIEEKSVYQELEQEEKKLQKNQTKVTVEKNIKKSMVQWLGIENNKIVISWEAEIE